MCSVEPQVRVSELTQHASRPGHMQAERQMLLPLWLYHGRGVGAVIAVRNIKLGCFFPYKFVNVNLAQDACSSGDGVAPLLHPCDSQHTHGLWAFFEPTSLHCPLQADSGAHFFSLVLTSWSPLYSQAVLLWCYPLCSPFPLCSQAVYPCVF